MSRTDTCNNKRRLSSDSSLNTTSTPVKPLSKRLYFENPLDSSGNCSDPPFTINMSNDNDAPPTSQANTQMNSQQSILTENDFKSIAKAVKDIMLDDLRKELKAELHMVVHNATAPLINEIEKLKFDNNNLRQAMNETLSLSEKVDDLEQHSRKSCIRVSGVPQRIDEDTTQIVCDIARKLNVDIQPQDISACHRLPTPKGHKQIIARFTHTNKRSAFLKATKNIDSTNDLHGVSISQDLTKMRGKVAFLARQAKRNGQIKQTSVWDGKIYVTDKSDKKHVVTTESELKAILEGCIVSERNPTSMPNGGAGYIPMHPGFQMRSPYNMMQHVPAMYQQPGPGGMNPQMMSTMPTFH